MSSYSEISPIILGFKGHTLDPETAALIHDLRPAGFIVFERNCKSAAQLKQLCADLRACSPLKHPLIFIDQEGGRVVRVHWDTYMPPPPRTFGELYEANPQKGIEAAQWSAYVTARQLQAYGVTVNCMPLADLLVPGAHHIIGDRSFGQDPHMVGVLCGAFIKGLMAGGLWPVLKHAPGHGRALVDSHKKLPVVCASAEALEDDFLPFKMNNACPFVMTAHVRYEGLDQACATTSKVIMGDVLRKRLGVQGLIVADDMFMQALKGALKERIEESLSAGCDLVICGSSSLKGEFQPEFWQQLKGLIGRFSLSRGAYEKLESLPPLPGQFQVSIEEATQHLTEALAA